MAKPKRNLRKLFIFNGLLLLGVFAMLQYAVVQNDEPEPTITVVSNANQPFNPVLQGRLSEITEVYEASQDMPNLAFKTAFEKDITLEDLKGQWVVLNFWATWCAPCLVEMPSLQALQDKISGQKNIKVVAVSLDRDMDGKKLREFMNANGFGAIAAYYDAEGTIMRSLTLEGLPSTLILNPSGQAVAIVEGDTDWASDEAMAFIESL